MTNNTINKIFDYKVKALKTIPEYPRYPVEEVLGELLVSDPIETCILGALLKTSMLKEGKTRMGLSIAHPFLFT